MHKRFVVTAKTKIGKYWILWDRYKTYEGAVQAVTHGKEQSMQMELNINQWKIRDRLDNGTSYF